MTMDKTICMLFLALFAVLFVLNILQDRDRDRKILENKLDRIESRCIKEKSKLLKGYG